MPTSFYQGKEKTISDYKQENRFPFNSYIPDLLIKFRLAKSSPIQASLFNFVLNFSHAQTCILHVAVFYVKLMNCSNLLEPLNIAPVKNSSLLHFSIISFPVFAVCMHHYLFMHLLIIAIVWHTWKSNVSSQLNTSTNLPN